MGVGGVWDLAMTSSWSPLDGNRVEVIQGVDNPLQEA